MKNKQRGSAETAFVIFVGVVWFLWTISTKDGRQNNSEDKPEAVIERTVQDTDQVARGYKGVIKCSLGRPGFSRCVTERGLGVTIENVKAEGNTTFNVQCHKTDSKYNCFTDTGFPLIIKELQ